RLRTECECACDDAVVQFGARRTDYAQQLVDLARLLGSAGLPAAVPIVRQSKLERRIQALFDETRSHGPLSRRSARILLAVGLALWISLGLVDAGPSLVDQQPASDLPVATTAPGAERSETGADRSDATPVVKAVPEPDSSRSIVLHGKVLDPKDRPI